MANPLLSGVDDTTPNPLMASAGPAPAITAAQAPSLADAYGYNADAAAAWLAHERALSQHLGLWNDATGMPTGAGVVDAARQYANGVMMGTTAPSSVSSDGLVRDVLGGLIPKAQVNGYGGGAYGQPTHYSLDTTSPALRGRTFNSLEDAESQLTQEGWGVVDRTKDGYGRPRLVVEHTDTADALKAINEADTSKWQDAEPVFVRYGKLPPNGRSQNHIDGSLEDGVSVYHGQALPSGEARPIPQNPQQEVGAVNYHHLDVPLYVVRGDVIGTGTDGEPLLRNAKIIRRAK